MNKTNKNTFVIIILGVIIVGLGIALILNINLKNIAYANTYISDVNSEITRLHLTVGGKKIVDGTYDISEIDVTSDKTPKAGWLHIEQGKVVKYSLKYSNVVNLENGKNSVSNTLITMPYRNLISKKVADYCTVEFEASDRVITKGDKYSCDPGDGKKRTFYVIQITDSEVYMIMDRNIGDNMPWCKRGTALSYDKKCNGDGVKEALATRTAKWKNVKVSLPTYNQMMWVNNKGDVSFRQYPFIYSSGEFKDNCSVTDPNCVDLVGNETPNQKTYGYWLESSSWLGVNCAFNFEFGTRSIFYHAVGTPTRLGIRPVITVARQ